MVGGREVQVNEPLSTASLGTLEASYKGRTPGTLYVIRASQVEA